MMKFLSIKNNSAVALKEIPVLRYDDFVGQTLSLLTQPQNHCVSYHAIPEGDKLRVICGIARDDESDIAVYGHLLVRKKLMQLSALSRKCLQMQQWEREISENFGISFTRHPWPKPVRFGHDRADTSATMKHYPFYTIKSDELHQVGVGPIHAGIIEPGHFRFLCHGESVLHLEIQLGYQHRGVEKLMLAGRNLQQKTVLAESIAGDTTIGHTLAFVHTVEALTGQQAQTTLAIERTIALELERIALHVGDLSALCTDIAYQLGSTVLGALRTPIINFMQLWCGNRFGKGLLRAGQRRFPLSADLRKSLIETLDDFEKRFSAMAEKMFSLPSVLQRFEKTGIVTQAQAAAIGAVGMAARTSGIMRDIRQTHPFAAFIELPYEAEVLTGGDVYARAYLRKREIEKSLTVIRGLLESKTEKQRQQRANSLATLKMKSGAFGLALVEGWRGEICHCAITDDRGELSHYKVIDPSFRNWLAMALAVRENEISDFPVCNKSFNLSYCGHDL